MTPPKIKYAPTEAERRAISVSFGVATDQVPRILTAGELNAERTGVTFAEAIGGHRIALYVADKPGLQIAVALALAAAAIEASRAA